MTEELIGTYEPWQSLPEAQERIAQLETELADMRIRQLAQGGRNAVRLAGVVLDGERYRQRAETAERENAELRKAYEPVERAFRVVWTACAFGYEGTPVGEALNHIKAWFDGVKL